MTADPAPSVAQALSRVMGDVMAVKKGERNAQQGFNFRGIDAVINAVGPAMRKHGVVAVPVHVVPAFEQYQSKGGAAMRNTTLTITWRFYGPDGDHIEAQTIGEASDAGDKSVSKAHSVAYRTLLLQALCIPTDEPDPDAAVHERAVPTADPRKALKARIWVAAQKKGLGAEALAADFVGWSQGEVLSDADAELLARYEKHLTS